MPRHPVDIAVALWAAQQRGNFAVAQAKAVGADDALIWRRVRSGRWIRRAPGVLNLPGFANDDLSRLWVALLDAGPAAMASHETAAALHGLDGFRLAPASVLVAHGRHHENAVATVHQTRRMPAPVLLQGLPATPIVRTLLDIASTTRPVRLGRTIDQAVVAKGASLPAIRDGYEWMQRTRRRGAHNLGVALEGRTHGYEPSRSELERLLDAILVTLPVAPPEHEVELASHPAEAHRVDRVYRWRPLIVEGDGRLWHARLAAMERDKRRDRAALRLGIPTVRYSWDELAHHADDVRGELLDLLGLAAPDILHPAERWAVD